MPDIQFVNSPRSEEVRWKATRTEVANGWFVSHGFVVVPELQSDVGSEVQVIFPRKIDYTKVYLSKFEMAWKKVEKEFWDELDHYLPVARKMHDKVTVDVGTIGTISSSYWSSSHYYLRSDRSVADLAAMIVNNTLLVLRDSLGITWTKREALMDFIMTRPAMRKIFPKFEPVFAGLTRVPAHVRKESEKYVRSLGIKPVTKEIEVVSGKIVIIGKVIGKELTKKEKVVLKLLITHKGELVTYDELADSLWGQGEFKTFWAINKIMGRMRPKLAKMDLRVKIEPVRGQGYILQ